MTPAGPKFDEVIVVDDEHPTPERGYPVQPDPAFDSVRRRARTPQNGVPAYEPPRRARSRADTDEIEVDAELERAFDVLLRRRLRPVKWLLGIVATTAIGAAGGGIKSAIDGARQSERQLVRIEILERDLGRVQNAQALTRPSLVPTATTAASPTTAKGTP